MTLEGLADDERWVIFNIQQTGEFTWKRWLNVNLIQRNVGYYRVNYDTRNWKAIIDELHGELFNSIHSLNRAQLLDDSFNLARYNYLDFNVTMHLIKYLHQESDLIPLTAGFKAIEFLLTFLDQEEFFNDLRDILLSVVDEVYVRINNVSLPAASEDEDYHVLTKLHVNMFACKVGVQSCVNDVTSELFLFDLDLNDVDVNKRPYLYCGILGADLASLNWLLFKLKLRQANGNEEFYRDNQEEFNEIFDAFSTCDRNFDRVELFLNDVFNYSNETEGYENVTKDNSLQIVGNMIKTSSAHRALMMKFFSENFDAVNEK